MENNIQNKICKPKVLLGSTSFAKLSIHVLKIDSIWINWPFRVLLIGILNQHGLIINRDQTGCWSFLQRVWQCALHMAAVMWANVSPGGSRAAAQGQSWGTHQSSCTILVPITLATRTYNYCSDFRTLLMCVNKCEIRPAVRLPSREPGSALCTWQPSCGPMSVLVVPVLRPRVSPGGPTKASALFLYLLLL